MRKIIAVTTLCLLSLVFKNEAVCKSNSQLLGKEIMPCSEIRPASDNTDNPDIHTSSDHNGIKPYDGFFFKI